MGICDIDRWLLIRKVPSTILRLTNISKSKNFSMLVKVKLNESLIIFDILHGADRWALTTR